MYQSIGVRKKPPVSGIIGVTQASHALTRLISLIYPDVSGLPEHLFSGLQLRDYALGDPIYQFPPVGPSHDGAIAPLPSIGASRSGDHGSGGDRSGDSSNEVALYFIVQGEVRLLCHSRFRQRDVTAQLLQADDVFGADGILTTAKIPYQAIAASSVRLLLIPKSILNALLSQYPALAPHLQVQARHCERLVFFKSMTDLASQSSHQIQQWIPYLTEQVIPAQTDVTDHARRLGGRWWLCQGSIQAQSTNGHQGLPSLQMGDSWGDPHDQPTPLLAQTEVVAYQLPSEYWELSTMEASAAASAGTTASAPPSPGAATKAPAPPPSSTLPPASQRTRPAPALPAPPARPHPASSAQPPAVAPAFPKPLNRKLLDWLQQYPWVEQQSSSDCGAACLAMVSRYWGKRFPLNFLREQANVGRSGTSLRSLAKAAEGLGYHSRPVRASLGRMAEQDKPWIAHWQGNHYVVVYRVSRDQVAIADPAMGRQLLSRQSFISQWTGYGLLLDPTDHLRETEVKQATLGRYVGALMPYRTLALQVIGVSLLIQIFGLVTPLFTQIILDQVVVQKSLETLNVFAVGLVLFGIWSIAMSSVRQYLLGYFSNRLDLTLISGFIRHAVALPLQFFESRRVGDIITRVQENQKIQRFLIGQVVLAWLNFVTGFVYLGLMLHYNWRLTLLVLGLIPPIVVLTLGATPFLRKISRQIFKEAADQNSALVEMMTGIHTIKSAAAEQELRWRWEENLTRQLNVRFRGQKFGIGLQAANGLVNTVGSTLLLWYGASSVIQGQLTIGQFVAFNMMIGYVISPVIALAGLWDELQEVLISVERLNDVFETRPEELPGQPMMVMPPLQGHVSFENVTFRYSNEAERNTLQNISFEVQAGQTIAVIGRSGSGKSTVVKLLEGLYHPGEGRILIDGHDIRHTSPPSLRSQLGVVPQECFLFSGTILENILLYRSEFSLEDAVEAAKTAEAHSFIQSLPLGYHTPVGERGSTLSGGQRQRIAIARALLGDPRILILDEATSSLDTESERRFQKNLAHISRDRTAFIIAHRLSTVRHADQILVLDQGVLVEQGNHDELMACRGLYYHLVQQQLNL